MLRPTTTTEIPPPSAPKDISTKSSSSSTSPKTRRTPSFLFDSPPSAPLAPTTSNATATSTSKPTKSKNNKDNILSSPQSPRRSFFPSPSKSSFSSANSGGSSGFAGGIFSLSSLLARMPSTASIVPILSSSHHHSHHHADTTPHSPPPKLTTPTSKKMAGGSSKDSKPEPARMTAAEKQEAVRNAQAILASVRNDWEWAEELRKSKRRRTATADSTTATSPTSSSGLPSVRSEEEEDTEDEDDREYRSRDESDSDDSKYHSSVSSPRPVKSVYPDDEPKSAYRFHDPTSIGSTQPSKEERKARRKKDLEEEMKWNDGLRIWVERRDLWTQADKNGRVPIGKSKFEENPFYDAIIPDAYPQLYQRIIIKSNTPTIPINLQHMTNALVEGWKADGQWPPKPSKPEPSMTKKKSVSVGESMVKRVFGIGR